MHSDKACSAVMVMERPSAVELEVVAVAELLFVQEEKNYLMGAVPMVVLTENPFAVDLVAQMVETPSVVDKIFVVAVGAAVVVVQE